MTFLRGIEGKKIKKVKYEGGTKYAKYILLYFEDGDILNLETYLSLGKGSIETSIEYLILNKDGNDKYRK